jgi:hypothetical protein
MRDSTPPGAKNWWSEASFPLGAEPTDGEEEAGWEDMATEVSIIKVLS